MFKSKRELTECRMPTAEEFASWGAYELSFEELLEVNGGKQVKDDPRTDRNSDTCPHSSNAPGERSSGGSSSSGGPNKGEERSPTQGGGAPRTECSPPAKRDTSSGGSSGRSSSSGRESGGSSDSKPSNPGGANKGEERSPTQGGGAPRTECSPPSKRDSSSGGGSFDRGERDRDSDRDSGSSGGGGSGYRPSAQSQPVPKPPAQHGQGNGLPQKPNPAVPALPEECKRDMLGKNNSPLNLNKPDFKPVYDNYGRFLGYGDEAEKRKLDLQKAPSLDASFSIGGSIVVLQGYAGFNISQDYSGAVDVDPKLSADIGVFAPGVTATVSLGASLPGNEGAKTQELNLNILGFGGAVAFSEKGITSFSLSISANAGYQGDKSDMGVGYNLFKR